MSIFDKYALYYDDFYENKNYSEEVNYIERLIKKHSNRNKSILDLGCGTGLHALQLVKNGHEVYGVDSSSEMLSKALQRKSELLQEQQKRLHFNCDDIRALKLNKKFDIVTSLFHVMSYQITDNDITDVLVTVQTHLNSGGLFIFDFWYGPGVLSSPPEKRTRNLKKDDLFLTRMAEPTMLSDKNVVEVKYTLTLQDSLGKKTSEIVEYHNMRYFFKSELIQVLSKYQFKLLEFLEWMSNDAPEDNAWNGLVVAQSI